MDRLFGLWSTFETRRYRNNQPTWALFIDLVKAFDTAHIISRSTIIRLFELLRWYVALPKLVDAVKQIYWDMMIKVELKVGKKTLSLIDYTIGVQQGDIMMMAPVLFQFLMQAIAATLWKKVDCKGTWYAQHCHFAKKKDRKLPGKCFGNNHSLREYYSSTLYISCKCTLWQ